MTAFGDFIPLQTAINTITVSDNTAGTFGGANLGYVYPPPTVVPSTVIWPPDPVPKEKKYMRGLFEVFVVNPENDYTSDPIRVIAKDEASARLKAVRDLNPLGDVDDYDIIVRRLGDVRPKREVREVKVLKD